MFTLCPPKSDYCCRFKLREGLTSAERRRVLSQERWTIQGILLDIDMKFILSCMMRIHWGTQIYQVPHMEKKCTHKRVFILYYVNEILNRLPPLIESVISRFFLKCQNAWFDCLSGNLGSIWFVIAWLLSYTLLNSIVPNGCYLNCR